MLSYAGYRLADGSVIGDPQNVEFTDVICLAYSNFACSPILTVKKNHFLLYADLYQIGMEKQNDSLGHFTVGAIRQRS